MPDFPFFLIECSLLNKLTQKLRTTWCVAILIPGKASPRFDINKAKARQLIKDYDLRAEEEMGTTQVVNSRIWSREWAKEGKEVARG